MTNSRYSGYSNLVLLEVYSKLKKENQIESIAEIESEVRTRYNISDDEKIDVEGLRTKTRPPEIKESISEENYKIKKFTKEQLIKRAWSATLIYALLKLAGLIVSLFTDLFPEDLKPTNLAIVDIIILLGLSYGIYKLNRICSVLNLGYFIYLAATALIAYSNDLRIDLTVSAVFTIYAVGGVLGVFRYNKEMELENNFIGY